jgi:hypothetical protein
MPKANKKTTPISEKNTKAEIIDAYQELMHQITNETPEYKQTTEEHKIVETAAKETVEKIVNDLSQLKLTTNQTIGSLTDRLTEEAEKLATLKKAITLAKKELEESQQITFKAGILQRLIATQIEEEEQFEKEIAAKRNAWAEEQKTYEDQLKKQRSREEDEYTYQRNLERKREKDNFEEEKRQFEKILAEEKASQAQKEKLLHDLQKEVDTFPAKLEKEIKQAVTQAIAQEKKDAQVQTNFAKQEAESQTKIAALKITSLETMVKTQTTEIEALKQQLQTATKHVKDIAISVVEGNRKESSSQQTAYQPQTTK